MIKRKKHKELSNDQEIYKDIFNQSELGLIIIEATGVIYNANREFCHKLRKEEDELIGSSFLELISNQTDSNEYVALQKILAEKDNDSMQQLTFHYNQDKETPYLIRLSFTRDKKTNLMYGVGTLLKNPTPQTEHPGRIKEKNEYSQQNRNETGQGLRKLVDAFDQAPSVVVITDLHGKIEYVNNSFSQKTGYSIEQVIGKTPGILTSSHHPAAFYRDLWLAIMYGKTWSGEFLNKKKNGHFFWEKASIAPIKNLDGKITHFIKVAEDITRQKEVESALKKSQTQLKMLSQAVKQSSSSIIITRLDGTIDYVNPAFTHITGYKLDEVAGKSLRMFKPEDRPTAEYRVIWDSLLKGDVLRGEFCNVKKNNEHYWVLSSMSPILDEKGKISHYVMINEDITARKEAEQALRLSEQNLREANATKDKLFSLIGHDLRNAFNIILLGTQIMLDETKHFDQEQFIRSTQRIHNAAQNTYDLLQNLLTWSQTQMKNVTWLPRDIKISPIATTNIGLFSEGAKEKEIVMYNSIPEDTTAYADQEMVNTVIRNLINNALKFTNPGGTIQIIGEKWEDSLLITISDTGVGIDPEYLESIFYIDSTYQQRGTSGESGTGLGLPLCREFVEKNNGKIWVESQKDKGSAFKFTLPLKNNN